MFISPEKFTLEFERLMGVNEDCSLSEIDGIFSQKLRFLIQKYRSNAFSRNICGELEFHDAFGYFPKESVETTGSNAEKGLLDYSISDPSNGIAFSYDSLNLKTTRALLYKQYKELMRKHAKRMTTDNASHMVMMLIMVYCIYLSKRINAFGQFTFAGERLISNGNVINNECKNGNWVKMVQAVPFRMASSLSEISSLRLIEKIGRLIKKIKAKNDGLTASGTKCIKIAILGKFDDEIKNGTYIEEFIREGYSNELFDGYSIEFTYFTLKELTPFAITVAAETKDGEDLVGNLLDRDFYITKCKNYDMICMLDMGCFYTDTNTFADAYGETPYGALKSRFSSYVFLSKRDGDNVENISYRTYDGLYSATIKWIEHCFYGKTHFFEFDPRLFFTLDSLHGDLGSRSVYLFLSRDRGQAISSSLKFRNLCKGEYYNGRDVIAYDWSNRILSPKGEDCKKRIDGIFSDPFSKKNLIPIRLWKVLKSMGDYFYTDGFVNLFSSESVVENLNDLFKKPDFDFVEYAIDTRILIDYSGLKNNKLSFSIVHSANKSNVDRRKYSLYKEIAEQLVYNLMKLALDSRCFEDCSSGYCRSVLVNAMTTDSFGLEHLLVAKKLQNKTYFSGDMDVSLRESQAEMSIEALNDAKETYAQYVQHQKANLTLCSAIDFANCAEYKRTTYLVEKFEPFIRSLDDEADSKQIQAIALRIIQEGKQICEKIGYYDCGLYKC